MSNLILITRLRRKIDYALDVLTFIESERLREVVRNILRALKDELVRFSNLLIKQNNPLTTGKLSVQWNELHQNFLAQWKQLNAQEAFQSIASQSNSLQLDWFKIIENEINVAFTSNLKLNLNELREIAKQRLLEYELVEFGERIKIFLPNQKAPSCFISYAWGNKHHENHVHQLAYLLKRAGIDVMLDIWCNKVNSVPAFTQWVHKEKTDFVIVIGTHLLKQKDAVEVTGRGSWVHEELQQIGVRKKKYPNNHGIIKLLLEGPAEEAFSPFLDPLAHDYTDFDLAHHYYEKLFNLLELLYVGFPAVHQPLKDLRITFDQNISIIDISLEEELGKLLQLENPMDYLVQESFKQTLFDKIKNASRLFDQFVEREFGNEILYAEMLRTRLRTKYAENDKIKRLFYPDNPLPIACCYLHLALVQNDGVKQHKQKTLDESVKQQFEQRDYLLHEYEHIDHIQSKLELHHLLQECKTPNKRIYIEGAAGAGKSTLSQRIAYDWSQGKAPWNTYKWLFHVRLRDLKNVETEDYLHALLINIFRYGDEELQKWQLEKIRKEMREQPRQVMFLLDGYDELQIDTNTLRKLLEPLKNYDFIVTSRPSSNFKDDIAEHRIAADQLIHLAVLGFNDEQIEKYVTQFFDPEYNKPEIKAEEAQVCIHGLRSNPNLWSLAHIPIQLELLCSIWGKELKEQSVKTFTNIYELMFEKLLRRLEMERKGKSRGSILPALLHKDYAQHKQYLEYLAYLGMQKNKIVLTQSDIDQGFTDLNINVGEDFLSKLDEIGLFKRTSDGEQGEFLHLTFQEFLAAKYWASFFENQTTQSKAIQILTENRDNPHYQVMWWFVAGLLSKLPNQSENLQSYFNYLLENISLSRKGEIKNFKTLLLTIRCLEEAVLPNVKQKNDLLSMYEFLADRVLLVNTTGMASAPKLLLDRQNNLLLQTLQMSPRVFQQANISKLLEQEARGENQSTKSKAFFVLMQLRVTQAEALVTLLLENANKSNLEEETLYLIVNKLGDLNNASVGIVDLLRRTFELSKNLRGVVLLTVGRLLEKAPFELLGILLLGLTESDIINKYRALYYLKKFCRGSNSIVSEDVSLTNLKREINQNINALISEKQISNVFYQSYINNCVFKVLGNLKIKDDLTIKYIIAHLNSDSYLTRQNVIKTLGQLGLNDDFIVETLMQRLKDENWSVRKVAAKALEQLGKSTTDEVVRVYVENLLNNNLGIRRSSVEALGQSGRNDDFIVEALVQLLNDEDLGVRKATSKALEQLGKSTADEVIRTHVVNLWNINSRISLSSVVALGQSGRNEDFIVGALMQRLKDEDINIRTAATEALEQIGKSTTGKVLRAHVENLSNINSEIRRSNVEALGQSGQRDDFIVEALAQRLNDKVSHVRKAAAEALEQLGKSTADEVVRVHVANLLSSNSEIRQSSVVALGQTGLSEDFIVGALVQRLNDKNLGVRKAAVKALEQLGESSTDEMVRVYVENLSSSNSNIRQSSIEALCRSGRNDDFIVGALVHRLSDEDSYVRKTAVKALEQLGKSTTDEVVKVHVENLSNINSGIRQSSVEALGRSGRNDDFIVGALVHRLSDEDSYVRKTAVKALEQLGKSTTDEVVKVHVENLSNINSGIRQSSVEALGHSERNEDFIVGALVWRLNNDDDSNVRTAAAEVLGKLRRNEEFIVEALVQCLNGYDLDVKKIALKVLEQLGKLTTDKVVRVHLANLSSTDSSIRQSSVEALGRSGRNDDFIVKALMYHLNNESLYVRKAAAKALGQLGRNDDFIVEALVHRLNDKVSDVRKAVAEALEQLGKSTTDEVVRVHMVNLSNSSLGIRQSSVEALGQSGRNDDFIVGALVHRLNDEDSYVRKTAAKALEQLDKSTTDEVVRVHVENLSNINSEIRQSSVEALGQSGRNDDFIVEELMQRLNDEDLNVRKATAETLGQLKRSEEFIVEVLVQCLNNEVSYVRKAIAKTLGQLGRSEEFIVEALVQCLKDKDSVVSNVAAKALEQLGKSTTDEVVNVFVENLSNINSEIRHSSVEALGRSGRRDDFIVKALVQRLNDEASYVRKATVEALGHLGRSDDFIIKALKRSYRMNNDIFDIRYSEHDREHSPLGHEQKIFQHIIEEILIKLGKENLAEKLKSKSSFVPPVFSLPQTRFFQPASKVSIEKQFLSESTGTDEDNISAREDSRLASLLATPSQ